MNAQEAESAYRITKSQLDAGQITLEDYNKKIAELRYQDNAGTWWGVSPADGSWLKWTGTEWVPAFAQAMPAVPQMPVQPAAQPVVRQPVGTPVVQQAAAIKPSWPRAKKLAVVSIICGIVSFILIPYILGTVGIILGALAVKGRSYAGALGIVLCLAAMGVSFFYIFLVP